jgi:hypothetical protein
MFDNRRKEIIMIKKITGVCFALILLIIPFAASAATFKAEQQPALGTGETVQGNLYMAGGNVSSAGNVRGDLVVGGGNVIVSGPVGGDLLIGGGSITVTSDVNGDIRVVGGNIAVQGKAGGDVVIGAGQVSVGGAGVGGDIAIAAGSVTVTAPVNGNIKIGAGEVKIDAPVKGNVEIMAEKVTLGSKALINGSLIYTARDQAAIQEGAKVMGKTDFTKREAPQNVPSAAAIGAFFTIALLVKFLMALVAAFVFLWIFPHYAQEIATSFGERPLENLGYGFVGFVVIPVAAVVLCATIIGLPLGALALLCYIALVIFSTLVAPVAVGALVHKWIWKPAHYVVDWKTVLLGVALYFVMGLIPLAGGLVKFIIIIITFGIVMMKKWGAVKNWR